MTIFRLAAALVLFASPVQLLAAEIKSDFNEGAEGWRHGQYSSGATGAVVHDPSTGSIRVDNGWYGGGFLAPDQYLGNKSAFVNGELSFQLSIDKILPAGINVPALVLAGANGQTIFADWGLVPGAEPTYFTVSLTADSFYKGDFGTRFADVTTDEFAAIMADLSMMSITADWYGGDVVNLYEVSMTSMAGAVPEPATWAMMIGGFFLVGLGMRRQQARVRAHLA